MPKSFSQDEIASRESQKYTNFLRLYELELMMETQIRHYVGICLKLSVS